MENNNKTDIGCIIGIIIFFILNLITLFKSPESVKGVGSMVAVLIVIGIIWYIVKKTSSESDTNNNIKSIVEQVEVNSPDKDNVNKKENADDKDNKIAWGCFIGAAIVIGIVSLIGAFLNDFNLLYFIGAITSIVISIIAGVYFYNSFNDK